MRWCPPNKSNWHDWFAWHPVRDTFDDAWLWMEIVHRRLVRHHTNPWEYRWKGPVGLDALAEGER